jgi:hypothetical protein
MHLTSSPSLHGTDAQACSGFDAFQRFSSTVFVPCRGEGIFFALLKVSAGGSVATDRVNPLLDRRDRHRKKTNNLVHRTGGWGFSNVICVWK